MMRVAIVILLAINVGCVRRSDTNQDVATTLSHLRAWADYVRSAGKNRIGLADCETLEQAVDLVKKHNWAEGYDLKILQQDYWGREYQWKRKPMPNTESILIKITSFGRDGIDQHGKGDDLFIEIVVTKDGKTTSRLNRE